MNTLFETNMNMSQTDIFASGFGEYYARPTVIDWYVNRVSNNPTEIEMNKIYTLKLDNGEEDEVTLNAVSLGGREYKKSIFFRVIMFEGKLSEMRYTLDGTWKKRKEYALSNLERELSWNHNIGLPQDLIDDMLSTIDEKIIQLELDKS